MASRVARATVDADDAGHGAERAAGRQTDAPPFDLETYARDDAHLANGVMMSSLPPVTVSPRSTTRPTISDDPLLAEVRASYGRRDYDMALRGAHEILRARPLDPEALSFASDCRSKLEALYEFTMSSRFKLPTLAVPRESLTGRPLDHRAGFVLSLLDGRSTVDEVLDLCPLPAPEVLKILFDLAEDGTIDVL